MSSGTSTVIAPYRSEAQPGGDGFSQLLRAEWTKFRTVRGWVIGMVVAALVTVLLGVLTAVAGTIVCGGGPDNPVSKSGAACRQSPPLGPDGEAVSDSFYFVHQPLTGNGSITVRMTSLSGLYSAHGALEADGSTTGLTAGTQPWSKAGIIIKQNASPGSAYAAMMTTGGNGVRMQYNYTHDIAGDSGQIAPTSPRWLRLTRSGDTITGYDSLDGATWTPVGTATLAGLPSTVQIGLFAASPDYTVTNDSFGGHSSAGGPTLATGTFDNVALRSASGSSASGSWTGESRGADLPRGPFVDQTGVQQTGGIFSVTGTGDIAPAVGGGGSGRPPEASLLGSFAGLIAIIVLAVMFITAEYRRGLIRLTLAASPRRGRVLAAKAMVIGVVAFVVGLVAAGIVLPLGSYLAYGHGIYVLPVSSLTKLRLIVGTAALFALVATFALGLGTLLRRSAGAVTGAIVAVLLPYILAVASVLPAGAAQWLTRLTPAAAFSVQQSMAPYPQVTASYTPANGYYPLPAWGGLAVLCGYTALVLWLASLRLRRTDV